MSFARSTAVLSSLVLILAGPATLSWANTWTRIGPEGTQVRALAEDASVGRVYAATRYGGVFVSLDDGGSWAPASSGLPTDVSTGAYQALYGVTVNAVSGRVYAMGGSDTYISDNQGQSWTNFERPSGAIGKNEKLYVDPDDSEKLTLQNQNGVFVYDFVGGGSERSWWEPPGMTTTPVFGLERAPSDPDVFYAVVGYQPSLYRSDDRVDSWSLVGSLPGTEFRDLTVDPQNTSVLYLSLDTGCFVTTDGGQNWVRMDDPSDNAEVFQFLPVDGVLLAMGRGDVLSNAAVPNQLAPVRGFYHTRSFGALELSGGAILFATEMGVFESTPDLATGSGALIHRPAGMTFTDVTVVAPAKGSNVIYACAGQSYDAGIFRSADGGATWELRSMGLTNPDVRSIAVYPGNPDIVYVGTSDASDDTGENGTIFKTTDGGLNWTNVMSGLDHDGPRIIIAILVHPQDPDIVYASVQAPEGGIYKSTDGGTTWVKRSSGLQSMPETPGHEEFNGYYAMLSLAFDPADPQTIFIGAGGCWGGTYHSTNGADTWIRRSSGFMEYDEKAIEYGELGVNGEGIDFWFPVHLEMFDIDVDPSDRNHLYATGARGDYLGAEQVGILYESKDGGENWALVRESGRSDYFASPTTGLAMHAARPGQVYVSTRDGVKSSDDGGTTWSAINEGLNGVNRFSRGIAFDADDANTVYLATAFGGVFKRELPPTAVTLTHLDAVATDLGTVEIAWGITDMENHAGFHVDREVNGVRTRLTDAMLRGGDEFRFEDTDPVAGSVNRYWVIELDRSGRETEYGPVEVMASGPRILGFLADPFPNPTRESTTVQLVSAAETHATVRIYDVRGREVLTLHEGVVPEGVWQGVWDGRDSRGNRVTAGIYFVKAIRGGETEVKKLVLNR